tara:strand:- start:9002 stop:9118 length:117 start_codon:yes stop_codon:yes gene_type:complete
MLVTETSYLIDTRETGADMMLAVWFSVVLNTDEVIIFD